MMITRMLLPILPCLAALMGLASSAQAVPALVNYQGFLRDDQGVPVEGNVNITLSIFDLETGGAPLWSETHPGIAVSEGIFDVVLGSITPLPPTVFDDGDRWLETGINGLPLTPRRPFLSTPYALRAAVAEVALESAPDDDWVVNGNQVYRASPSLIGVGTASPTEDLHVVADGGKTALLFQEVGGASVELSAQGSIGFLSTQSNHPLRFGVNNDTDLTIDTAHNVGINTTTPSARLDVNGNVEATNYLATQNLGSATAPADGGIYRDNQIYAWARVNADGSILESFGVSSVTKIGTGSYRINLLNSMVDGAVFVTAVSPNDPVNTTAGSLSGSSVDVRTRLFIAPTGFTPFDYGFYCQVVGRP